jgi:hypothetical protein
MNEIILLGAGASVEAGIPDATKMTQKILESFDNKRKVGTFYEVLTFIISGLIFQKGINGENPYAGVNIEEVFNALQILSMRDELEAAPFIGSWHSRLDDFDIKKTIQRASYSVESSRKKLASTIDREIKNALKRDKKEIKIGGYINQMISPHTLSSSNNYFTQTVERKGAGEIFERTNEYLIRKLKDYTWLKEPDQLDYLFPLINRTNPNSTIASLNYDNCIELACIQNDIPYETGIDSWSNDGYIGNDFNGIGLLKLHGSINWKLTEKNRSDNSPLPSLSIDNLDDEKLFTEQYKPALIFGQRNKLTAKGPFLELFRIFQNKLAQSDTLTIIGYSFRDEHINDVISTWFNSSKDNKIRIINGENFNEKNEEFSKELSKLSTRVRILYENASTGIKTLYEE